MIPAASAIYLFVLYRFFSDAVGVFRILPPLRFRWRTFGRLKRWWESEVDQQPKSSSSVSVEIPIPREVPFGWRVRDLSFAYSANGRKVFDGFNLDVSPGESLAVCGPSGMGKTTLLHLLLGELSPQLGKVEVIAGGGVLDVATLNEALLPRIAYAGAESFLLAGTLRENLLYGLKREISDAELVGTLRSAACDFVLGLPLGLEHTINDYGEGLSMGQKQRLCFARALLRKPQALILDEVTAHLDEGTEAQIADVLIGLRGKVTVICATHRSGLIPAMQKKVYLGTPPGPQSGESARSSRSVLVSFFCRVEFKMRPMDMPARRGMFTTSQGRPRRAAKAVRQLA